ncbi:hypothetical protein V5P93_002727 [Actinokineospora auranticolor]|uniref:hypothetical protein n=1 Tax=Actinokineospora auranticolor TaxID=155976 RepID=UPI0015E3E421|nr:hypothetical protein [Actinokineospora auranticolor]
MTDPKDDADITDDLDRSTAPLADYTRKHTRHPIPVEAVTADGLEQEPEDPEHSPTEQD